MGNLLSSILAAAPNARIRHFVFQSDDWQEVRFDIDESVAPDLIGTMTDMSAKEVVFLYKTCGISW